MSRPRTFTTEPVRLRFTEQALGRLEQHAAYHGIPIAEVIRRAVDDYLTRNPIPTRAPT